ncbi:MAG: diguanylate cyclase, partial [Acidimicrobiales bacterium]|nr:diguanylate cyclase [Acidimicrobiales bacterium]
MTPSWLDARIGLESPAIQNAPVAVYAVDLAGRVISWNRGAERLFGWTAREILGQPVPFLPPEQIEPSLDAMGKLLAGEQYTDVNVDLLRKDGSRVSVLTSATLLTSDDGEPLAFLAFASDVTRQVEVKQALDAAQYKWRKLLENISDTVTLLDSQSRVIETTGEFTDVLGYDSASWVGRIGLELIHESDRTEAERLFADLLKHPGREYRAVFRTLHQDGHLELIEYTGVNLLDDPIVNGIVISTRNVTEVKRAEALLADEAAILELIARDAPLEETLPALVLMVEEHSNAAAALFLLEGGTRLTVGAPGSLDPRLVHAITNRVLHPSEGITSVLHTRAPTMITAFADDPLTAEHGAAIEALGYRSGWVSPVVESRNEEVLGMIVTLHLTEREPTEHERNVVAVASHLAAIAIERGQFQRELYHQARHHQLTGLPNRRSILEVLEHSLERARADRTTTAVMFIDLDRFKVVNDSLGHAAGDQLLVRFGRRLQTLVRPGDYVGHFGADEFVVVLEQTQGLEDVEFIADRLKLALTEPFSLEEGEIFLSASIGVAFSHGGAESSTTLLEHADAAMFRAKELGRDRLEVFDEAMRARAIEQLSLDRDLRLALERGELELYYQPEIDLRSGRVVGVEALMRWHHGNRGTVWPTDFIAVAEDTGLIVRMGRWVIEQAISEASRWVEDLGLDDFLVGVNLSARQLTNPDLIPTITRALDLYRWSPNNPVSYTHL